MNSKDVKRIAVVSIADGGKLGTVDRAFLDPAATRVVGFAAGSEGGLFDAPDRGLRIDAGQAHSLGPDALTLDDAAAATGNEIEAADGDLLFPDDLTKLKVVTEGGTYLGQVAAADVDERSFALTALEVSPGVFAANRRVPIAQVLTLGQDVVVVSDAVARPEETSPASSAAEMAAAETPGVDVPRAAVWIYE